MHVRTLVLLTLFFLLTPVACSPAETTGLRENVTFDSYSSLSESKQLLERMLTPIAAQRLQRALTASHQALRAQAIDLSKETFVLFVPAIEPPGGYGLLVFVPPWEEAKVPSAWRGVLERRGVIFVSVSKSGNAANVLDRREPLALLAAHNIAQRYRLDPARIYIGGFSGGSRVALRLALAYPDLFRGVLLNAGSDPIGNVQVPLPSAALFSLFQQSTRVVYVTGKNDREHLDQDTSSRRSLQEWCVNNPHVLTPWSGHETADPASLDHALNALGAPERKADAADLRPNAICTARIERELAAKIHDIEDQIGRGDLGNARSALDAVDAHYGGLAAPRSTNLADRLETH